jgi:hypothetical protein
LYRIATEKVEAALNSQGLYSGGCYPRLIAQLEFPLLAQTPDRQRILPPIQSGPGEISKPGLCFTASILSIVSDQKMNPKREEVIAGRG